MKATVKRKVHAQRKFAQGAFVPAQGTSAPAPASQVRESVNVAEVNVVHQNLSAKALLDLVAMNSNHQHQPLVLLQRLQIADPEPTPEPAAPSAEPVMAPTAKRKRQARKATRSTKNQRRLVTNRRILRRSNRSVSDFEDEWLGRDLKQAKKNAKAALARVTRSKKKAQAVTEGNSPPVEPPQPGPSKPIFKAPAIPVRSAKPAPTEKAQAATEPQPGTSKSLFKEPNIPAKFARPAPTDERVPNLSITAIDGNSHHYYGNRGISQWLIDNSTQLVPNADDASEQTEADWAVRSVACKQERAVSPCPSLRFQTVRDVMSATPSEMSRICQSCDPCTQVNVVQQIRSLVHTPNLQGNEPGRSGDVYDFDGADDDAATLQLSTFSSQRGRPRCTDPGAIAAIDSRHRVKIVYLDLQKNSAHCIEITLSPSDKRMIKARLVKKSEARAAGEFSPIEFQNLLDQPLDIFNLNDFQALAAPGGSADKEPEPARAEPTEATRGAKRVAKPPTDRPAKATKPDSPRETPSAKLMEAPTFYPTEEEFTDPIKYIIKITPAASKYGMCKIVAPANFKPKCVLNDQLRFKVANHYIARLYSRWGAATREISAMRSYLATQNVTFSRVPLLESLEMNLPKLYSVVQRLGGLKKVIMKKLWGRVAEELNLSKGPATEKALDKYYVKYLLPYDTASNQERSLIMGSVERIWNQMYRRLVKWASNPLHHQKKLLGESDSSDEESTEDQTIKKVLAEAEDCVVAGRPMTLSGFKKVAAQAKAHLGAEEATVEDIEKEYWRLVLFGTEHVCVNAASIDTAASGYGFSRNKKDPCSKHPWNLKMISNNGDNVLRALSGVVGVTAPTLHLGMIFSTCCWHRDPHGLPWLEYMHEGPPKIWYGIPDEQSEKFRRAVELLCPTSCQNKHIWLSSDITMIPPDMLLEHRVTLSRAVQNPGEFIVVFPKSYSCSISTGFTVSESVYFATNLGWLTTVHEVFQELRESCEPSAFSLEELLMALASDEHSTLGVLHTVHSSLATIVDEEIRLRNSLIGLGLTVQHRNQQRGESPECSVCRCTLYLSKVTGVNSKKTQMCLLHGLRIIERKIRTEPDFVAGLGLVVMFSDEQLEETMGELKLRLVP